MEQYPGGSGVGTMMVLVTATMFAVLFGILKTARRCRQSSSLLSRCSSAALRCAKCCCSRGDDPRKASFFGGIITCGVVTAIVAVVRAFSLTAWAVRSNGDLGGFLSPVIGGPLGYAAGCLVVSGGPLYASCDKIVVQLGVETQQEHPLGQAKEQRHPQKGFYRHKGMWR